MALDDYIKAGKIAGEVRENVRKTDWVGKTVYEICLLYTSPSPRD